MPFPNSHKYYWDLPMYSKSFGVLQKFYSLKIESVMWGGWWVGGSTTAAAAAISQVTNQHSTAHTAIGSSTCPVTSSGFHVACLGLVLWGSRGYDCQPTSQPRKHIPIYFLLLGPRFPPNTRWLSSLPKGNSPIIAQLLRCHDIHENDGGMENAPNIRSY